MNVDRGKKKEGPAWRMPIKITWAMGRQEMLEYTRERKHATREFIHGEEPGERRLGDCQARVYDVRPRFLSLAIHDIRE